MENTPTELFQKYMDEAIASLPEAHREAIKNVAFFVCDKPTKTQLQKGDVQPGSLLLGLYEGVPLTKRQGRTSFLPDTITLFQHPIEQICNTQQELREQIRHTVWHEVAHYFGLNHDDIHALE